jgi:RNA polymerase sigma-70 factor (ECF subfamily)
LIAALHAEHAEDLRRFLVGVLKNAAWAEDAFQATFAKAVELGHGARPESLKGWLFTVAYREALQLRRQRCSDEKYQRQRNQEPSEISRLSPQPDQRLISQEAIERVREALKGLPAEQREVVRLRIYEDCKFAEIAERLKLPLGTVLSRMQLALKKLRRSLDDESH